MNDCVSIEHVRYSLITFQELSIVELALYELIKTPMTERRDEKEL